MTRTDGKTIRQRLNESKLNAASVVTYHIIAAGTFYALWHHKIWWLFLLSAATALVPWIIPPPRNENSVFIRAARGRYYWLAAAGCLGRGVFQLIRVLMAGIFVWCLWKNDIWWSIALGIVLFLGKTVFFYAMLQYDRDRLPDGRETSPDSLSTSQKADAVP
ncbi:MAG: hypothetical protein JW885_01165 [Deltaproteobacteria bacterium]|nr:hypothetical protein [Candidatus Zymogenaceae bacterium]